MYSCPSEPLRKRLDTSLEQFPRQVTPAIIGDGEVLVNRSSFSYFISTPTCCLLETRGLSKAVTTSNQGGSPYRFRRKKTPRTAWRVLTPRLQRVNLPKITNS